MTPSAQLTTGPGMKHVEGGSTFARVDDVSSPKVSRP